MCITTIESVLQNLATAILSPGAATTEACESYNPCSTTREAIAMRRPSAATREQTPITITREKPEQQRIPAAAKSLQSCPTLCDPMDCSPPGSPSLGFSRQEHWSQLPFPFPMHESEKWKWSRSVVSDSSRPHRLQPTRLLRPWDFPGKSTGVGCHCLLQKNTSQSLNKKNFF